MRTKKMLKFVALTILPQLLVCCGKGDTPPASQPSSKKEMSLNNEMNLNDAPTLKIKVFANGSLMADDHQTTLDEFAQRLTALKQINGVVWYYRQEDGNEPPHVARQVIALIIQNKLPVRLSTKPDFSDSVGPNSSGR